MKPHERVEVLLRSWAAAQRVTLAGRRGRAGVVTLPGDEQAFLCHALAQLAPDVREVFTARMVEHLQALADPGVGDVDRALRAALVGLWIPPDITEWRRSDWDCETLGFDRASKRAW